MMTRVCKEGFAPPGCCECDLSGLSGRPHYKDPVTGECKRELTIYHAQCRVGLVLTVPKEKMWATALAMLCKR